MSKVNRIHTSTGQLIIFKPTGPLPVVEPEWNKQSVTPGIGVTQQGARVLKLKKLCIGYGRSTAPEYRLRSLRKRTTPYRRTTNDTRRD